MAQSDVPNLEPQSLLRGYDNSLPIALLRARETVIARFRPNLAKHKITEQQWRVLRALAESKSADATRLSDICCILMPSLSRILKNLEARQYIGRRRVAGDGRRQEIFLTEKGYTVFSKVAVIAAEIYEQIEAESSAELINRIEKDLGTLKAMLSKPKD